ncbi:MAG: recombinase family protein [Candidatus Magasanikbacteria bacterium]|nr:recombinase family protein [Candidatus Magasanikbacteria bacterium]
MPQHDYVIYARKSTESEDRQVLSIPAQVDELRALAGRRGVIPARVVEESMSAKEPGRPKFQELMREVQAGNLKGIFCWKLDRLARNPVDGATIMWALTKKKLGEIITPSRIFSAASDDVLLMNIEFGMARKFIDDLSENVKRGQRARVARGWIPWKPPAGYKPDRDTGTVVKDPVRFPLVRRAFDLILRGTRPSEALQALNQVWGYRTDARAGREGRPLSMSRFYEILGNPFYAGLLVYNREVYQGRHDPMLSPPEFDQIQKILHRPGRPRPSRHEWAFTGLVRCGACGNLVSASFEKGHTGKQYAYYGCPRRHGCHQPYLQREAVEEQIAAWLDHIRLPDPIAQWCLETMDQMAVDRDQEREAIHLNRERTRRSLERQLTTLTDLRVRNVIADAQYLERRQNLLLQQEALSQPVREAGVFEPARAVVSLLNQAKNRFLAGADREKRAIVEAVCSNPKLLDRKWLCSAKKPFTLLGERPLIPVTSG